MSSLRDDVASFIGDGEQDDDLTLVAVQVTDAARRRVDRVARRVEPARGRGPRRTGERSELR